LLPLSSYNGAKVFVTGHTGFKGSWLTYWLQSLGAEVVGFAQAPSTTPSLFSHLSLSSKLYQDIRSDIRDYNSLSKAIKDFQPDFVFHLAAQALVPSAFDDPVGTFTTNAIGTVNLLEVLRQSNSNATCIFITSDKVYENNEWFWGYRETDALGGKDPYSASKSMAELAISSYLRTLLKSSPLSLCIARAGNVVGGGDWSPQRIVPDLIRAYINNKPLILRNPSSTRPWQHVLEPVFAYLQLGLQLQANSQLHAQSFNFGPSSELVKTVHELVLAFKELIPSLCIETSLDSSNHESSMLALNCDKALHLLNWTPRMCFSQLVQYTADWYIKFYETNCSVEDLERLTSQQIDQFLSMRSQ